MRKRVAVLGATGSIGTQTLDIIRQHADRLEVVGAAASRSGESLLRLQKEHGIPNVALFDEEAARRYGIPGGMQAIIDLALKDTDIVVVAVAGVVGLLPTIAAIKEGKQIALASKEVLVAAGELVMPLVKENNVLLTPIDSEHSAIFQCLQGYTSDQIKNIMLTASGGPFRGWTAEQLENVTVEQALDHPTWRMGGKITIDSATMMNKALEMIEARWLFGVEMANVNIVVHPQSIIHSMVTFKDGSALGQLGWPDMRLPIQYALLYPERKENTLKAWNPVETPNLTFESLDESVFGAPKLAREATRIGGTAPAVFNAANEQATALFLAGQLKFLDITRLTGYVLADHRPMEASIEGIIESDKWARQRIRERVRQTV